MPANSATTPIGLNPLPFDDETQTSGTVYRGLIPPARNASDDEVTDG